DGLGTESDRPTASTSGTRGPESAAERVARRDEVRSRCDRHRTLAPHPLPAHAQRPTALSPGGSPDLRAARPPGPCHAGVGGRALCPAPGPALSRPPGGAVALCCNLSGTPTRSGLAP